MPNACAATKPRIATQGNLSFTHAKFVHRVGIGMAWLATCRPEDAPMFDIESSGSVRTSDKNRAAILSPASVNSYNFAVGRQVAAEMRHESVLADAMAEFAE